MRTFCKVVSILMITSVSAQSGVIQRFSGTIEGTVTSADNFFDLEVGDRIHGSYEYFSEAIDGVFDSGWTDYDGNFQRGNGNLRGSLGVAFGDFPSHYPYARDGVYIGSASLTVRGGEVEGITFGATTDLYSASFHGTQFWLNQSSRFWGDASGTLAFGPIHVPESASTGLLLIAGCVSLLMVGTRHRARIP